MAADIPREPMTAPVTPPPLPAEAVEAAIDDIAEALGKFWAPRPAASFMRRAAEAAYEAAAPHLAAAERDHIAVPWRTGRRNGHTIYAQTGPQPSDDDPFIGSLNTPEAAAEAVRAHNALRQDGGT